MIVIMISFVFSLMPLLEVHYHRYAYLPSPYWLYFTQARVMGGKERGVRDHNHLIRADLRGVTAMSLSLVRLIGLFLLPLVLASLSSSLQETANVTTSCKIGAYPSDSSSSSPLVVSSSSSSSSSSCRRGYFFINFNAVRGT
jgi:hypothetical protein